MLWITNVAPPEGMADDIEGRLAALANGGGRPFAVIERASGAPIGMTTYMNVDAANRRLEIGATWYRASLQRTAVNTERKRLLLGRAFETLECIAVDFRTHLLNFGSRRAIERVGAKLDGVLRNHVLSRNGTPRHTCVYSIIASEWPTIRAHLDWQLQRPRPG